MRVKDRAILLLVHILCISIKIMATFFAGLHLLLSSEIHTPRIHPLSLINFRRSPKTDSSFGNDFTASNGLNAEQ